MRLSQFFCTSTSQNLSVSFHLSALMTTSRSHRAASTIHSTGRAEFLLLGTCRGPSGSYSSWKNCSLQQLFFYSTRIHIYRLLLQGPQDIESNYKKQGFFKILLSRIIGFLSTLRLCQINNSGLISTKSIEFGQVG